MSLSVIIPVRDEPDIYKTVLEIERELPGAEIIVSDGTLGKGYALQTGTLKAKGDIIVWIDADLQIHPREISTFLTHMAFYNADAVVGNKRHSFSLTHYPPIRKIVSITYNKLVNLLFGLNLRDTQCGLKVFRKMPLIRVVSYLQSLGYGFDLEVLVALKEHNCRIVDAPVFVKEYQGKGSVSWRSIVKTFRETIGIWMRRKRGYYAQSTTD